MINIQRNQRCADRVQASKGLNTCLPVQLIGFSAIFIYNHGKGFPLAAYGENVRCEPLHQHACLALDNSRSHRLFD